MPREPEADLSLFLGILCNLEEIRAPYMIIGAFAGTVYGVTRVTYDIDIVVDLSEQHMAALAAVYPPPRYYADVEQMRNATREGTMFNIIDSGRGEKADLIPLSMASRYRLAFGRRIRQAVDIPRMHPLEVWCARPDDVIIGKLMAWTEGRSHKHETDIHEILVNHYLDPDDEQSAPLDESYVDAQAQSLGAETDRLWRVLKQSARTQAVGD